MAHGVPVLGEHHVLEARCQRVDRTDDRIAIWDGERATRQEVVLDVDEKEHVRRFNAYRHAFCSDKRGRGSKLPGRVIAALSGGDAGVNWPRRACLLRVSGAGEQTLFPDRLRPITDDQGARLTRIFLEKGEPQI